MHEGHKKYNIKIYKSFSVFTFLLLVGVSDVDATTLWWKCRFIKCFGQKSVFVSVTQHTSVENSSQLLSKAKTVNGECVCPWLCVAAVLSGWPTVPQPTVSWESQAEELEQIKSRSASFSSLSHRSKGTQSHFSAAFHLRGFQNRARVRSESDSSEGSVIRGPRMFRRPPLCPECTL